MANSGRVTESKLPTSSSHIFTEYAVSSHDLVQYMFFSWWEDWKEIIIMALEVSFLWHSLRGTVDQYVYLLLL
jgi:hypothetical protein